MKDNGPPSLEGIRRGARRMQHSRERRAESPLRGLSAFGVIGWSIAIPAVGGALLGLWLDRVAPQRFSWTLALILGGLVIGVMVAWDWIARENRKSAADQPRQEEEVRTRD